MNYTMNIEDLAALVTVAGASIYILGLVGLVMPLRGIIGNTPAAWYATSMVPKTVVAGLGVRIWLQWPLIITVSALVTTLLLRRITSDPLLITGILTIAASQLVIYLEEKSEAEGGWRVKGWSRFMTQFFPSLFATLLIVRASKVFVSSSGLTSDGVVRGTIILFMAGFLLGVPVAIATVAPLPKVVITRENGATLESAVDLLQGKLVAHSDGFWHLLSEKDHALLSIPDREVLMVQTYEEPTSKKPQSPTRS